MMYPSGIGTPWQILKVLLREVDVGRLVSGFLICPNALAGISERMRKPTAKHFISRLLDELFGHYRRANRASTRRSRAGTSRLRLRCPQFCSLPVDKT